MSKHDATEEDLAIQNTLEMSVDERLELLAQLIVERIDEDAANGYPLLEQIKANSHG